MYSRIYKIHSTCISDVLVVLVLSAGAVLAALVVLMPVLKGFLANHLLKGGT
jgi:hypothetical protein